MRMRIFVFHGLLVLILMVLAASAPTLLAQQRDLQIPDTDQPDWWGGDGITGSWWGWRGKLGEVGFNPFASYTWDVFGNPCGGIKSGVIYSGALLFGADLNLERLILWRGATVSSTWVWLSGQDPSEAFLENFLTVSSIAGAPTLRMLELWFEQSGFDDKVSLRIGQLAADSEFLISDTAALFLNSTFGWPTGISMNLPSGGPAYPLGTLGLRAAVHPADWFTWMIAAFQGNVFDQQENRYGFRYRLNAANGYTFLSEAQLRWRSSPGSCLLPGQFKFGAWLQSGQFADALATTTSSGNVGIYAILDQTLWKESAIDSWMRPQNADPKKSEPCGKINTAPGAHGVEASQGINFFTRLIVAPPDRNVVDFYFDTGLAYQGILPTRDEDTLGVGFAYAKVTHGASQQDDPDGFPAATAELVLETTYQCQITNWLTLQPDLQWIIQAGSRDRSQNSLVIGFRGSITF